MSTDMTFYVEKQIDECKVLLKYNKMMLNEEIDDYFFEKKIESLHLNENYSNVKNEIVNYIAKNVSPIFDNNNLYFGSYPQSLVDNAKLISELNSRVEKMPNINESYRWEKFNYCDEEYMEKYGIIKYYIDIDIDNDGRNDYRGIYNMSLHDSSDFSINCIYWYKYEAIEWNCLNNKKFISGKILDCSKYYKDISKSMKFKCYKDSNGEYFATRFINSDLNLWLKKIFYNDVFNKLLKKNIKDVEILISNTKEKIKSYYDLYDDGTIFIPSLLEISSHDNKAKFTEYAENQLDKSRNDRSWWTRTSYIEDNILEHYDIPPIWVEPEWGESEYTKKERNAKLVYAINDGGFKEKWGVKGILGVRPAIVVDTDEKIDVSEILI